MIENPTSTANIQSMLQTMRSMQAQASAGPSLGQDDLVAPTRPGAPGFADLVRKAVGEVNEMQTRTRDLQAGFERGEVPLTDVVLSMQKSSLAFEATLQMRNKVMKAYEDILNMPV